MDAKLWEQVVVLHARVEHDLGRTLQRRHGIGLSEYRALSRLAVAPDGELRMQELADSIGLNQSSVSRLAVRLETDGLTRRDLCPKDRRGVYSVITDEGRTRLTEAGVTYAEALTTAMAKAAADPHLADVAAALGAIPVAV
ncbi:MarR family winged helix-turn-helix transcriptional regulator [Embleya scabrispora]|uniref:MarR family winged helix-turn-helix transcriptional regulator n=1 Tax=Embleya scabrispora TaxID=159449 RepID=UPI00037A6A8B|nr:MarR family transcriptional regulator [Embleya scabrispora]MYS83062.1 MarR family transcriptional regulator [Streptomyces sp. SID5474]